LRVIAGVARGRRLQPVPGEGTRPITDRVKESLFDILSGGVEDARFLDLFAGTGSVGIEALSRGAERAVFVDSARKAIDTVRRNLRTTGLAERAEVVHGDAFRFLEREAGGEPFHYVYVAPPQYRDIWARALLALDGADLVAADGMVIVQIHPKEYHAVPLRRLRLTKERRYGSTLLLFYEPVADAAARDSDTAAQATPADGEEAE
jgi:16S rRNA (guanine966-N2)-methyltransferase